MATLRIPPARKKFLRRFKQGKRPDPKVVFGRGGFLGPKVLPVAGPEATETVSPMRHNLQIPHFQA